ncbi:MAG TPA: hypothetical protein VK828_14280 [Terriglobales bacterium]|jgi:hypothetical protein|nr:hypothetical protein [Terriglobales bacterium]
MGWMLRSAKAGVSGFAVVFAISLAMSAQENSSAASPSALGGPQDWSHRHVIYTRNGSIAEMMLLRDDPRFIGSLYRHYSQEHRKELAAAVGLKLAESDQGQLEEPEWDIVLSDGPDNDALGNEERLDRGFRPPVIWDPMRPISRLKNKRSKVDWSISLGPTGGTAYGETPAIYTASYSTPSCAADFAVYTINATPGVAMQANLIGLNNLYSDGAGAGFCSGITAPTFLFSYAIGTGGSALSPVLSLDGTKIAWIENRTAVTSYLHVTKWVANQGGSATAPVAVTGTFANGTCTVSTASCDFSVEYTASSHPGCTTAHTAGNSHSDLYVDYPSNTGFISANNGLLYHISNIFSNTVSPTVDFCIPVNATFETKPSGAMSGPVYDPILNEVFLTDSEKIYAYTVNAASFSAAATPSYTFGSIGSKYNYQTGPGPLLDMFNGYLYVFSTYDAAGKTSVTQIPTSLASGTPVELGPESTNADPLLFYGAFDNNYFTYGPKSALSTLYSCGTDQTNTNWQDLFSISFNAATGIVNTTPAMSYNTNVNPGAAAGLCSPITEFYDGTHDRIFVGMGQPASATGSNVVTMWNVKTQLTNTSGTGGTMPTYTAEATGYLGGSGGFAADNNSTDTDAESIYFSTQQVGSAATGAAESGYSFNGIAVDGTTFSCTGGLDNDGNSYSATLLGTTVTWNGTTFNIGPTNNADTDNNVWSNTTVTLPSGQWNTLIILAAAVNVTSSGITESFTVNYTDGTSTTLSQSFSDWFNPLGFGGESIAKSMAYRDTCSGGEGTGPFDVYGYSFAINPKKTVTTLTLPATRDVVVLAAAVANNCGGADYCAVKLTQGALQ